MDTLLKSVKTEIDELDRLIRNYGKDGDDRKHVEYLNEKMKTFTKSIKTITTINDKIQAIYNENEHGSQPTSPKTRTKKLKHRVSL